MERLFFLQAAYALRMVPGRICAKVSDFLFFAGRY